MDLFHQTEFLDRYLSAHSSPEDPVLAELNRHTHLNEPYPNMLSGHVMGQFLTLIASLVRPERILEVGTYTGYSAICLAKGLAPGGQLVTLEQNDEFRTTAQRFFRKAGVEDRIVPLLGDARKLIPGLDPDFDLVFLDADKESYPAYFELILPLMKPGAYLLADNVLWGGKVIHSPGADASTRAIDRFNQIATDDPRVENLLIPIRDGVMLMKKL
ncbi:MAG: O-methyltransferase [Bacteroidales bacterium]